MSTRYRGSVLPETMVMMSHGRALLLACSILLLAACTGAAQLAPQTTQQGSTPPTTGIAARAGTLTGIVWACQGLVMPVRPLVSLYVSRGGRVIAEEAVHSGHHYRIELAPGVYTVSSPPRGLGRSHTVRVVAGETVHASMLDFCK